jgi:hypothetical protein
MSTTITTTIQHHRQNRTENITYLVVVGDGGGGDGLHDLREHERAAVAAVLKGLAGENGPSSPLLPLYPPVSRYLIADLEREGRRVVGERCDFFSGVVCFDESRARDARDAMATQAILAGYTVTDGHNASALTSEGRRLPGRGNAALSGNGR